jgi:hypothetical protein
LDRSSETTAPLVSQPPLVCQSVTLAPMVEVELDGIEGKPRGDECRDKSAYGTNE